MKKLILLLFLCSSFAVGQHVTSEFNGTCSDTGWTKITLGTINASGSIDLYDSAGYQPVYFAFSKADTVAAVSGLSYYVIVEGGAARTIPYVPYDAVWVKCKSGTAKIKITKY